MINVYVGGKEVTVLIDTWWNVNYYFNGFVSCMCLSFNRYMVECEFFMIMIN